MFEPLEGGCLCGRVRYRVTTAPLDGAYCHCRMCQKSSGAPLQASAEFPVAAFEVTEGRLKAYRSSPWALRRFCPDCGSQISYAHAEGAYAIMQALIERDVIGDFRAPDILRFGIAPLYTRFTDIWDAVENLFQVLDNGEWRYARFARRATVT